VEFNNIFFTIYLIYLVIIIISWWKVFEKAGQPGWAAIIPIYNLYIIIKISGKPGWWIIMLFVPFLNWIFIPWTFNMISKSFGKDEGFTVGLCLLGIVFWPILAFGPANYLGPYGDQAAFQAHQMENQFEFEQQKA
jgi:hypothetical protein